VTTDHVAVGSGRAELERLLAEDNAALGRGASAQERRRHGLGLLLDWLDRADGPSWQARWVQLGEPTDWQAAAGATSTWQRLGMTAALTSLLCHRVLQPGYRWLFAQRLQTLQALLFAATDRGEDARLITAGRRAGMSATMLGQALSVLAYVLVHTGRRLEELTTADLLAYAEARRGLGKPALGVAAAWQLLYELGIVDQPAPSKAARWRVGQRSMAELVDRYPIACRPVRDLLVRYLEERAPAMDYASVPALARRLAGQFWCDLERHHPGIATLHLPPEVAAGWRRRALLGADGRPRRDVANLFTSVRAFYLDLAQWAAEDPATWRRWVAPCPVTPADLRRFAKAKHHQQARLHARIHTLAPLLPALVAATHQHLIAAGELLVAAEACQPGETFTIGGGSYRRVAPQHIRTRGLHAPVLVKPADQPPARRAVNCHAYEADAFWAWAIIEVLRLTGIRLEELLELTHLSIRHYRLPSGELVVLLQVAPSKTDRERVIPVCPELAHVLAMIVARARGTQASVPLVERYDHYERVTSTPLPYLFQRSPNGTPVVLGHQGARDAITRAVARAGLREVDGRPLRLVPHDFRRLFATEAVNGGLPIHIAAKLLGHLDLNTTKGYVAVYPDQVVRHFQAHLARRRASRPSQEYRQPTEAEWKGFAQHFRRRRMALGDCYRPYGTDCPHEHACVRCPMLRVDPAQLPRLLQIEQDTHRLLAEAQQQGWEGEAAGLEDTLGHIADKKAQVQRIQASSAGSTTPVWLTLSPTHSSTASLPSSQGDVRAPMGQRTDLRGA
jgi:site-specific recombinase XerC